MLLFLLGIFLLIAGYFSYGKFIDRLLAPDDRPTPAVTHPDGVDFVPLPHWKNMLIQLLKIAGIGPVIGVILGIKFGEIVFLIIPIGNLLGGAVHDFLAGMMSLRNNGANLPVLIRQNLNGGYARFFSVFMLFLLLLVVAVFINIPAQLTSGIISGGNHTMWFWICVGAIFLYYVTATLFPVDKIIGKIYPIFGAILILSSVALFGTLLVAGFRTPELLTETETFRAGMFQQPVLPMLFVTIACGILSGFHATQSPIVARTMRSERQARSTFYGMMVLEGLIGMIWAAAGMAIFNLYPELMAKAPAVALNRITIHFLGEFLGGFTVLGVIVLAITSGDTAMRSLRLSLAELLHVDQVKFRNRLLLCLPLIALVGLLLWWSNQSAQTFNQLWNYFAWGNQVLGASTLMAGAVWLLRQKKNPLPALLPGIFMTFIVLTYILWISPAHGGPFGLGLQLHYAYFLAGSLAVIIAIMLMNPADKQSK